MDARSGVERVLDTASPAMFADASVQDGSLHFYVVNNAGGPVDVSDGTRALSLSLHRLVEDSAE